jgi:DNA-directed RNA polymerase subunit RPC12/RpoP
MSAEHEMVREPVSDRHAEEWSCPACGRRIVLTRPPDVRRLVLVAGDETAAHSGSAGEVWLVPAEIAGPADDRSWLREHGIAWLDDE